MSTARERAMRAYEEGEEARAIREREEEQQREAKKREEQIARKSKAFLKRALAKVQRTLGIDASGWEVVESHPTYAVLRDPDDEPLYTNAKLTLCVTSWGGARDNTLTIRYSPYAAYVDYGESRTNDLRGDGQDWHGGPVVTDMLSLGAALKKYDDAIIAAHRSMPVHLP